LFAIYSILQNRKAVLDRFGSYSGDSLLLQSNYITNLPKTLTDNAKKFVSSQEEEKLRKEEERKLQKEEEGKLSKKEKLQREKFLRLMRKPGRYDIEIEELTKLLNVKYRASLIEPGEAVGVILAQSLGEPSTQMT
jgi:DNA-directed RNA polymerase I subunit RPA1